MLNRAHSFDGSVTTPRQSAAIFQAASKRCSVAPPARPHSRYSAFLLLAFALLFAVAAAFAADSTNSALFTALSELNEHSAKQIPFKEVIEATTHHSVLDFDTNNPAHRELKDKILKAAALAGERAVRDGLFSARPNEAGNHIEPFVRAALRDVGLEARVPVNSEGRAQSTGYPDIEITGPTPCYLELKTYNASTADTTQRTFYYSPSEHPKVTRDALHFLLAYQLERTTRDGKTDFVPLHWKLITLQDLVVDLKYEFNQSNRGLYGSDADGALISEGAVK